MKDYSAMSDYLINQHVAESLTGRYLYFPDYVWDSEEGSRFDPCNNPADAWPIIVSNKISILIDETVDYWSSALVHDFCDADAFSHGASDNNPLRAAMIVYLQMMEQKL